MMGASNLHGHFDIFDMLFPFLTFVKEAQYSNISVRRLGSSARHH